MRQENLKIFREQEGGFISGEEISKGLGVTRAAVWKHVKQLQEDGYEIEAIPRKGYRLLSEPDRLNAELLKMDRLSKLFGNEVYHYESVDSTNIIAKRMAAEDAKEGTVIIAEEQTAGRGRLGRAWESSKGTGIWLSIILRPQIDPSEAAKITQVAAAAVGLAIKNSENCDMQIKWPNDIVINKRKVCGILTEMSAELDCVNYIIVGIGINANQKQEDFPQDIREYATSIRVCTGRKAYRKDLVLQLLKRFEELYLDFLDTRSIGKSIEICKKYSATLGNKVRVIYKEKEIIAEAVDITEDGELLIRDEFGEVQKIISGEVSVRGLYGYI